MLSYVLALAVVFAASLVFLNAVTYLTRGANIMPCRAILEWRFLPFILIVAPVAGAPLVLLGLWATASPRRAVLPLTLPLPVLTFATGVEILRCKGLVPADWQIGAILLLATPATCLIAWAFVLRAGRRRLNHLRTEKARRAAHTDGPLADPAGNP